MKIVDRTAIQNNDGISEDRKDDLFSKLLMGQEAIEEIETQRGKFTVKYPKSADTLRMGRLSALWRNDLRLDMFDGDTLMTVAVCSFLDVVVLSGPPWYEDAKKKRANFSWLEVPSKELVLELYSKALSFRENVEQMLDPQTGADSAGLSPAQSADDSYPLGDTEEISGEYGITQSG